MDVLGGERACGFDQWFDIYAIMGCDTLRDWVLRCGAGVISLGSAWVAFV